MDIKWNHNDYTQKLSREKLRLLNSQVERANTEFAKNNGGQGDYTAIAARLSRKMIYGGK